MNAIALAALGLVLGYATFQRAGVDPNSWNLTLLATGVLATIYFAIPKRPAVPRLYRVVAHSAGLVTVLAVFQLMPLPVGLVRLISPARVELLQAVASLTGSKPAFVTLTAVPYQTAEYVLTIVGYLLVFLTIRDVCLRSGERPWIAAWPLLVIAGLEALLGIYQATSGAVESASGTYANRDHFAGLLEMVLPFAALYPAAILQRERERNESTLVPALEASGVLAIARFRVRSTAYAVQVEQPSHPIVSSFP